MIKWFKFMNQSEKILGLLNDHIKIVKLIVNQMNNCIVPLRHLDWKEIHKIGGIINILESEADHVRKSIVEKICEGSYFGGIFSELLLLIDKIDNIADCAQDSLKILIQRIPDKKMMHCLAGTDALPLFIDNCVNSVYALDEAVKGLSINKQTALERVQKVKEREEDADLYKSRLLQDLFNKCKSTDSLSIIQLQNFINATDEIADNAEDASDIILILISRGYS